MLREIGKELKGMIAQDLKEDRFSKTRITGFVLPMKKSSSVETEKYLLNLAVQICCK